MIAQYNKKSLRLGIPGLLVSTAAHQLLRWDAGKFGAQQGFLPDWSLPVLDLFRIAGVGLFCAGLCYYAKAKGHHPAWGLVGLLSCVGILILACFRDRHPETPAKVVSDYGDDADKGDAPPPESPY